MTEVSQICHTRLEGQKLSAQDCYGHKLHVLKGQKLLAQGNALGIMAIGKAPCKEKACIALIFKAFALTGRQICVLKQLRGAATG